MGHIIKELNIIHINIQGLKSSKTELEYLIHERRPHIITLNETHLKSNQKFTIQNYCIIRKDRRDRQGGGVAILYDRQLPVTQVVLLKHLDEYQGLLAKIHIPYYPIYISTLYSTPNEPLPTDPINNQPTYHKSMLLTDVNAHHPYLGDDCYLTNRQGRELAQLLRQSSFSNVQLTGPTRYRQTNRQTFTTQDKILATGKIINRIQSITIHPPPNSDHVPVQITLTTPYWRPNNLSEWRTTIDYSQANWTKFRDTLETEIPDTSLTTNKDIDM